jgi:hypothetical protein
MTRIDNPDQPERNTLAQPSPAGRALSQQAYDCLIGFALDTWRSGPGTIGLRKSAGQTEYEIRDQSNQVIARMIGHESGSEGNSITLHAGDTDAALLNLTQEVNSGGRNSFP